MNRTNFYDLLGVTPKSTTEEIKKAYKVLALKYHPDKNLDNVEEATKQFKLVKEAYEVLIDPHQRAWYDKHKESFHNVEVDIVDHTVDEVYFTKDCFKGYNDEERGFYSVYRTVFDEIIDAEIPFLEDHSQLLYPRFGNSKSDLEGVKSFYDIWQSFSTAFTFEHLNVHDLRQAPNRRIIRLMEKENKRIRDEAKKNRNSHIQELVKFVRKLDKRMDEYRKLMEAKAAENRKKSEKHRLKVIEERNKEFAKFVESDLASMKDLENELNEIEAKTDDDYYDKKKNKGKKKKNKKGKALLDEEEEEDQPSELDNSTATNGSTAPEAHHTNGRQFTANEDIEVANNEGDNSSEENEGFYCEACNKKFKTIKSFQNHEKSKKHLACLERFLARHGLDEEDEEDDNE